MRDLIIGFGGDDSLNGGGGSDYLYGGEDDDTFIGSKGDDLFHGGGTRDATGGLLSLDDDGIDIADYSAAPASAFIKVTTDVTQNMFHSGAIDAAHRALIQQAGAGNGTATIVSVEKVKGTAGVDTFEVTQLVAAQLAGSDGKGGLAEVDLAGNDKPGTEGDLVDASRMTRKLAIDLDPAGGFIQVQGDAETRVKLLNAERAWGGADDDVIKGNDDANELKGGAGDDTLIGGNGNDIFDGGAGNDQIWGGALNAAASASDGIDEVRYGDSVVITFGATSGSELTVSPSGYETDTLHSIERIGGSAENDTLSIEALSPGLLSGLDWIDLGANIGASGGDRVVLASGVTEGVKVDLAAGRLDLISGSSGFGLRGVEDVRGGSGDDVIIGGDGANDLDGGGGMDEVRGGGGNDRLSGGLDDVADRLWGGAGNDSFDAWGSDVIEDIEAGDTVGFRGVRLTGGVRWDDTDSSRYEANAADYESTVYVLSYHWDGGSTLEVVAAYPQNGTRTTLTIENFQNGDGGIHLFQREGGDRTGTAGNDVLHGSAANDSLAGAEGNDILVGGAGHDAYDGGAGDDTFLILANDGFDAIEGGSGFDTIAATARNVVIGLRSIAGVERISANGFSNVSVSGTSGDDVFVLYGIDMQGIAAFKGGGGNDAIYSGAGNDTILGEQGDDTLEGGDGNDVVRGGLGGDHIFGGAGNDVEDGGDGNDTFDVGRFSGAMRIDLLAGTATGADIGTDAVSSFETVFTGGGDDWIAGTGAAEKFIGQGGGDVLEGRGGDDMLYGGAGDDTYRGGAGDDYLSDDEGDDTYHYGIGDGFDVIDEWDGFDVLVLGAGIAPADVTVSVVDEDVIFSFAQGGEVLVYAGAYPEYAIDEVRFADDTVWDSAFLANLTGSSQGAAAMTGIEDMASVGGMLQSLARSPEPLGVDALI